MENIKTETDFRNMLINRGFTVNQKHENDNSIDIVAIKEGHYFLIEIKRVVIEGGKLRVRTDQINPQVDFCIVLGLNGVFYSKEVEGRPFSKIVNFMDMLQ